MEQYENDIAVENFREYLRIPSVQPNIDYDECLKFLKRQSDDLGLTYKVYEYVPKKPIAVLSWEGTDPSSPSILLNSHMDVVPVFENSWTYPPFSAHMDSEGRIYARGSQDMKCVGIQYLEAIRKIKTAGVRLKRTLHVSFVPDEEIGGIDGMKKFVETDDFKQLNIGFALDEGMANPGEEFIVFYGERNIWQIHVHCHGQPGHGSLLLANTAGEKMRRVVDRFMDFRQKEKDRMERDGLDLGDVTTVNMTQLYGGVQSNVVPEKLSVVFDMRLAPTVNQDHFLDMIRKWLAECGEGITYEFEQFNENVPCTKLDSSNPFWTAFKDAADHMNIKLSCRIFPAATDSRYVRSAGVPALGFSPISSTPVLLHDHDEFLTKDGFTRGIELYVQIITSVANV